MKRWGVVWIVAILSCLPILILKSTSPYLLRDTDTSFLLRTIRERQAPFSWFTGDWPLLNHFYRPVSTLSFEMDNRLYGDQASGYALTNALLCVACVLLVAWLWRELTDSIPLTAGATALFGFWHWSGISWLLPVLFYGAWVVGFFGLFRHGFKFWKWLPAVGAIWFLGMELSMIAANLRNEASFYNIMLAWIPGRTASVMTIFCLAAMAAYARYERLSAERAEPNPTSMDEPAGTRSTVLAERKAKAPWVWAILALIAGALAFGSYEQAVMLPAALFGVAVSLKLQRYRVRWAWQIGFWGLLVLYFLARKAFLPDGTSGYQAQQLRFGPGVYMDIANYVLPLLGNLRSLMATFEIGWSILLTNLVYSSLWLAYSNVAALLAAFRHWVIALTGLALSVVAFLPMAWLNHFDHYHYWPMALRSLYVVVLAWGAWELCVIAVSPPVRQAPLRPVPAPGSLPHR